MMVEEEDELGMEKEVEVDEEETKSTTEKETNEGQEAMEESDKIDEDRGEGIAEGGKQEVEVKGGEQVVEGINGTDEENTSKEQDEVL